MTWGEDEKPDRGETIRVSKYAYDKLVAANHKYKEISHSYSFELIVAVDDFLAGGNIPDHLVKAPEAHIPDTPRPRRKQGLFRRD